MGRLRRRKPSVISRVRSAEATVQPSSHLNILRMAGRPFEKLFIRRGPVVDDDGELGKAKHCSWNWLHCLEEAISMKRPCQILK